MNSGQGIREAYKYSIPVHLIDFIPPGPLLLLLDSPVFSPMWRSGVVDFRLVFLGHAATLCCHKYRRAQSGIVGRC